MVGINRSTSTELPQTAGGLLEEVARKQQVVVESQWRLVWRQFRKHRLAVVSAILIIAFYVVALIPGFIAYVDPHASEAQRALIAPQRIYLFDDGRFRPHVFALTGTRNPQTFQREYVPDPSEKRRIMFFAQGYEYQLFGVIPTTRHLIGVEDGRPEEALFLFGTDVQGRDIWSRVAYATQISLTIGLAAVIISLVLGITLGSLSGYYGGLTDLVIQRIIEILHAIPTIPLWMALAASLPRDWSILRIYFAMTIIISFLGWIELARVVRGRFLSLRTEDFVTAARVVGCGQSRIIFRHMVPSFLSHIIAATTLALPAMIISETALSFLGLGLRPPAVSWGVLLQQAQNVQAIALTPWLLIPAVFVIVAILAFNFVGDGLRDAADPYSRRV